MLIGVTTCLNYSIFFKETISSNLQYFDKFYVITSPNDLDTINLCEQFNKIEVIKTDVFFDKNAPFYKSAALNTVLDNLTKDKEQWCAIIDADVILPTEFKDIDFNILDKDCIYSYIRDVGPHIHQQRVLGYFQLFNTTSVYYNFNYNLAFRTAAGGDIIFAAQWPKENNILLTKGKIKHVAPPGKHWCGVHNINPNGVFLKEVTQLVGNNSCQSHINKAIALYTATQTRMLLEYFEEDIKKLNKNIEKNNYFNNELKILKKIKDQLHGTEAKMRLCLLMKDIENFINLENEKILDCKNQIQKHENNLNALQKAFNNIPKSIYSST